MQKLINFIKYNNAFILILNSETKELEGYEPVIKKEEREESPYTATVINTQTPLFEQNQNQTSSSKPTSDVGSASSSSLPASSSSSAAGSSEAAGSSSSIAI